MNYLDKELEQGTDPSQIAYIAFSNVAAKVAKERIKNKSICKYNAFYGHQRV